MTEHVDAASLALVLGNGASEPKVRVEPAAVVRVVGEETRLSAVPSPER